MTDDFEDHCWKDVVAPDVLDLYSHYARKIFVGPAPALLAIDLYELAYQGGAKPPAELHATYPSTCGEYAYAAIEPTKRLFAAARAAGIPIFYTTMDTRPDSRRRASMRPGASGAARPGGLCHPLRVQAAARRRGHHQAARERVLRHAADRASDAARRADHHHLRREHVGLRARLRGRRLFPRLSTWCWSRSAASTAASCRTRSICSTCTTNTPT